MMLLCNEESWVLVGTGFPEWRMRAIRYRSGARTTVTADSRYAFEREEKRGDVQGFMHTHPMGGLRPSLRDIATMRAWCDAFGKPLLCIIESPRGIAAYRFDDYKSVGRPLSAVWVSGKTIVGVEHARKVSSRSAVPRRCRAEKTRRAAHRPVRRRRARQQSG
jgi:proteasome lid subunit RPN8/RPN11